MQIFLAALMMTGCAASAPRPPLGGHARGGEVGSRGAAREPPSPRAPGAYLGCLRAELAAAAGHHEEALRRLRQAISEDPESVWLRVRLAEWLVHEGKPAAARGLLRRVCRGHPDRVAGWRVWARLEAPPYPARALGLVRRVLRLAPEDTEARLLEAALLRRIGRPREATARYRRLLAEESTAAEAERGLGYLALGEGSLGAALGHFARWAALAPFGADPWLAQARTLWLLGQPEQAAAVLRQGLEATGDDHRVAVELARLARARTAPSTLRWLAVHLAGHETAEDLGLAAQFRLWLGQWSKAATLMARALALDPESPEAVRLGGQWLWRCGARSAALEWLVRVSPRSRAYGEAQRTRAALLEARGGAGAALSALGRAVRRRPDDPALWEALAIAWAKQGRLSRALDAGRRARRLRGWSHDSISARYARLLLRVLAGRFAPGSRATRALLGLGLDDPAVLNLVGYALVEQGGALARAERLLVRAWRLAPLDPDVLDSLGWLRYKRGDLRAAAAHLGLALRLDPWLTTGWRHLAAVRLALGRPDRAATALVRLLRRAPAAWERAVARGLLRRLAVPTRQVAGPAWACPEPRRWARLGASPSRGAREGAP